MAAKVFITTWESDADYKVYFVDSDGQQKNHQIITGGKLVSSKQGADVVVFITTWQSSATIKITRKNFPK